MVVALGDGGIRKRVNDAVNSYSRDLQQDVNNIMDMVYHRIMYGSPPLLIPSEDAAVSPRASLDAHQERIRRRRQLLGLPYEEWKGIGGK